MSHSLPDSENKIKEMCDNLVSLKVDNVNDEINITDSNIDEECYNIQFWDIIGQDKNQSFTKKFEKIHMDI